MIQIRIRAQRFLNLWESEEFKAHHLFGSNILLDDHHWYQTDSGDSSIFR